MTVKDIVSQVEMLYGIKPHNYIFRLINDCLLDMSSEVQQFSKTAKERIRISTPSYHQVIKPLYSHSSGRWKRYEKQTANVYPILETWIKKFNYYIHSKT